MLRSGRMEDLMMMHLYMNLTEGSGGDLYMGSIAKAFSKGNAARRQVETSPVGLIEEYKVETAKHLKLNQGGSHAIAGSYGEFLNNREGDRN